jgi:hypothetical protein
LLYFVLFYRAYRLKFYHASFSIDVVTIVYLNPFPVQAAAEGQHEGQEAKELEGQRGRTEIRV